jgi:hypothetical protein
VSVQAEIRVLVAGFFDATHEDQHEAAAVLVFRYPGLPVIFVEVFVAAGDTGRESVGHYRDISAG